MAIVLAIEPDKRQAAHLTAILMQVDAELVIADTTEGALDAIGNRVPDLVLVPALLSPQDDAALAAALRVIAAAAHVRTLTIPVLASSVKRAASRGMLSKWRKNRVASPEPDGCDPAVFGEQISTYLSEAAAERALIEEDARLEDEPTPAAPPAFEPSRIHASLSAAVESPVEHAVWAVAPLLQEATAAVASLVDQRDMPSLHTEAEVDAAMWREPGEPRLVEEEHVEEEHVEQSAVWAAPTHQQTAMEVAEAPAIEHNEEIVIQEGEAPLIDLSMELATLSEDTESGAADIEPVAIYTISVEGDEPWDAPFVVAPAKLNPPLLVASPATSPSITALRASSANGLTSRSRRARWSSCENRWSRSSLNGCSSNLSLRISRPRGWSTRRSSRNLSTRGVPVSSRA